MFRRIVVSAPKTIDFIDHEDRELQPGTVRVEAMYLGISIGTEMNTYRGGVNWHTGRDPKTRVFHDDPETQQWAYPASLGYAHVGRVVEVSSDVEQFKVGDLVYSSVGHMTSALIPATRPHPIPDGHDPRNYVFFSLVRTAINIVQHASPRFGDTAVVFGAGVVGLLTTRLLKMAGAANVISFDLLPNRRKMALDMGADFALDPRYGDPAVMVRDHNNGRAADVAIEASANEKALRQCPRTVVPRGRVILGSMPNTPFNFHFGQEVHFNAIQITGANVTMLPNDLGPGWDSDRRDEWARQLLDQLDLVPLITHEFDFEDAPAAYRKLDEDPSDVISVVLKC